MQLEKIRDSIASQKQYLEENPVLKTLFIELTIRCNERCRHCGSSCGDVKEVNKLQNEEILQSLKDLKADLTNRGLKLPYIVVTGGEPLLREDFLSLMQGIHSLGYNWGMTTNAQLVTDELAVQMKQAGLKTVGVSLDGLRENHEWLRQIPGCYDRTIRGIRSLVNSNIQSVLITTMVYPRNINELDEVYNVVKSLKCQAWRPIGIDPIGRAKGNETDSLMLNTEQLKYLLNYIAYRRQIYQANKDSEIPVIYTCNYYLGMIQGYEKLVRDWFFRCNSGLEVCSIGYNGDILGCLDIQRDQRLVQGNVRTDRLYDTWISKFEIFRKNKALESSKCQECSEKEVCRGGGFHTWNIDNNEPNVCLYKQLNLR